MKRIRLTELTAKDERVDVSGGLALLESSAFGLTGPYAASATMITRKEVALKNTSAFTSN
jgi:hypothetical protein